MGNVRLTTTSSSDFTILVHAVLSRHTDSALSQSWTDARLIDPNETPDAYWIRETADLVNIVWLSGKSLFDVTLFPNDDLTTFSWLPLANVGGIEIRKVSEVGTRLGYPVSGDLAVKVFSMTASASLNWIASQDEDSEEGLREFVRRIHAQIAA